MLDCKLTSYRITRSSPLKRIINSFIRKYFEFGFYDKHLEWKNRLSDAIFQSYPDKSPEDIQVVLTMDMAYEIFLLYMLGILTGSAVFIVEIILKICFKKNININK